jgi:hypothetical protein
MRGGGGGRTNYLSNHTGQMLEILALKQVFLRVVSFYSVHH